MVICSPFSDKYPNKFMEILKKSRKGKDCLAPLSNLLNSTRLYEHVLKYNQRYWLFSVFGGIFSCYAIGNVCDWVWKRANKGKLYTDLPYTAPEDD